MSNCLDSRRLLSGSIQLFFFSSITTPQSGKKMVTGVQVVNAFQVQIIGCRWQAIFVLPKAAGVCVCVAVTTLGNMESDLGTQCTTYQVTACRVMLNAYSGCLGVLIGDNCSHIKMG